jgi:hypothetical protein
LNQVTKSCGKKPLVVTSSFVTIDGKREPHPK